jgi:hypothetical protein
MRHQAYLQDGSLLTLLATVGPIMQAKGILATSHGADGYEVYAE